MTGVYQHCSEAHLHRYLAEFDFRYSNRIKLGIDDTELTRLAIKGAGGAKPKKPEPPKPPWPDGSPHIEPVQLAFPFMNGGINRLWRG
jgi:hypothetical protein